MATLEFLRFLPILSVLVWFSLAALQVIRDRIRTWTERFFLLACVFTGLYALSDLVFFNASTKELAEIAASASVTSVTFAAVFFFLFTQVYVARMRRWTFALLLPPLLLLPVIWTVMVSDVVRDPADPTSLFVGRFGPVPFAAWLLVLVSYSWIGIINVVRLYRIVKAQNRALAKRVLGVLLTLVTVFMLGLGTNGYLGTTQNTSIPPPFSSLLVIPGLSALVALYPVNRERVSEVMRKFKAKKYRIDRGFVVYNDGTLVGSAGAPGEGEIDRDLFSATLDVIQNFMRTSFPLLAGKSLKTIEHGDLKILIERAKFCYLAVVLTGEDNDLIRRQMRDELIAFEQINRDVLARWRGVQEDAVGTQEMLTRLLTPPEMFPK